MNIFITILMISSALFLSACTSMPVMNKPLDKFSSTDFTKKELKNTEGRSDDLSLILTFSGGGTRAAALSYGVLEKLKNTSVYFDGKNRRLLDEIDLISSVSGGSFTSAYYGLFGDEIFKSFESKFLKKKIQTELLKLWLLNPKNWVKLVPAVFGRSDLVAQYYSEKIFNKKTFADLRKDAPQLVINATDLSVGKGFAFTPYYFSWICSDLQSFPIGRAVAASSAVPVLFSPVLLENHMGECNYSPILWASTKNKNINKRYRRALDIKKYRNNKDYAFLHLVDGGVADNLGIRSLLDMVAYHNNSMWDLLKTYGMKKTKKMVFIVVNASNPAPKHFAKYRNSPSTQEIIQSVARVQSNQFNDDTVDYLRNKFLTWQKQIKQQRCAENSTPHCSDIKFYLIEVSLNHLKAGYNDFLKDAPTSLELSDKVVDKLKASASQLLDNASEFHTFLNELKRK